MTEDRGAQHPEDLPWNDAPADDAVVGGEEPDPAEVEGEEGDEVDTAARRDFDPNRRETLDERLAEEEPEDLAEPDSRGMKELMSPEAGAVDTISGEGEGDDEGSDGEAAEDAAMHITREGQG